MIKIAIVAQTKLTNPPAKRGRFINVRWPELGISGYVYGGRLLTPEEYKKVVDDAIYGDEGDYLRPVPVLIEERKGDGAADNLPLQVEELGRRLEVAEEEKRALEEKVQNLEAALRPDRAFSPAKKKASGKRK